MNYTHEQMKAMLYGAYKKLKSYYFYDKSLLFIKKKLAEFEDDQKNFKPTFDLLADALISENIEYFSGLIEKLDFKVFPKKLAAKSKASNAIIGTIDHNKNITKVNFFIDVPVELLILDCLWTLYIAKIGNKKFENQTCSYAGKLKKSVFGFDQNCLYEGVDWASNRFFEPYFKNYSQWQKDAFANLRHELSNQNQIMLSLDLKSFYYSVQFEFDSLKKLLDNDLRLQEISFVSSIEEKLYLSYTKMISKYKMGIANDENTTIFPIGLLSPILLRELYLYEFDQKVKNTLAATYYGRYVDDMIIIIPTDSTSEDIDQENMCNFLVSKGLITQRGSGSSGDFVFVDFESIAIQKDKINCFFFEQNASNILIDVAERQIRDNSSEANLLPEFDLIKSRFNDIAYYFNSIGGSTKIRDIGILQSNNYAVSKSITAMKQLLKNTYIHESDREKIKSFIVDLLEFYSGSSAIEFMGSWTSVFELLLQLKVLSGDRRRYDPFAQKFYKNIVDYIDYELTFDMLEPGEIYANRKKAICRRIKKNLMERLGISISLAMALDYRWKTAVSSQRKNIDLAKQFRKSNIFNHNLVSLPLINYLPFEEIDACSLLEVKENPWNSSEVMSLDQQRLFWTPRFLHLDELYIYYFMQSTQADKKYLVGRGNIENIWEKYVALNGVERFARESVVKQSCSDVGNNNVNLINVEMSVGSSKQHYVALANTTISEADALQSLISPNHKMTIHDKERLFSMANAAVKEGANFITFPEFFIPVVWLRDITRFSQKNNITVITGLRYIKNNNRVFNCTAVTQPCNNNGFQNSVTLFREKNFYAPEEKESLYKLGYYVSDPTHPLYYIIHANKIKFSTILCYEFTDIFSRAALKTKVDALFVPQLNKDTNYFASIVESTARDLHCFIVQANTSSYGDSRITAPYDTIHKNIVQIKGGKNDVIIIGELDFEKVRDAKKLYEDERRKMQEHCFKCKKIKKYPDFFEKCKVCPFGTRKHTIKDVPANFE